jgi:cation transport ATPase
VALLRGDGLQVQLLSGDAPVPARAMADALDIANWTSGATPQSKVARL